MKNIAVVFFIKKTSNKKMLSLEINKIDIKKNRINNFVIEDIKIGVIYTNQKI